MKIIRSSILSSAAILLAFCGSAMGAGIQNTNGDLVIGFYQVDENGIIGSNTYIFNLGPVSKYRENTQKNVSVTAVNTDIADANIAADLTTAFGPEWAENGTVRWLIVGGFGQAELGVVNGDTTPGTTYISRPVSAFNANGPASPQPEINGGNRNYLRTGIEGFLNSNNGVGTAGSNPRGAIIPTTSTGNLTVFINSATGEQFGINQELRQTFGPGVVNGTADSEGVLDLWRMIHSTSTAALNATPDVDFTSGFGTGNVVLGKGQYCGTITLDINGELKIGATADAPPAGNYASFATENGLGAAGDDSDGDGVKDLLEYALATNLTGPDSGLGALVDRTFSFTKRAAAVTNGDLTYAIEESDDLGLADPWQTITPTTDTDTDISYTLPPGKTKVFARLKVSQAP